MLYASSPRMVRKSSHWRSRSSRFRRFGSMLAFALFRAIASSKRRCPSIYSQTRTSKLFHSANRLTSLQANKKSQPTIDTLHVYFSLVGSGSQAQAHAIVVDDGLLFTQTTHQRELNQPCASSDWHKLLAALWAANPTLSSFVRSYSLVLIIHALTLLVKCPRSNSLL